MLTNPNQYSTNPIDRYLEVVQHSRNRFSGVIESMLANSSSSSTSSAGIAVRVSNIDNLTGLASDQLKINSQALAAQESGLSQSELNKDQIRAQLELMYAEARQVVEESVPLSQNTPSLNTNLASDVSQNNIVISASNSSDLEQLRQQAEALAASLKE